MPYAPGHVLCSNPGHQLTRIQVQMSGNIRTSHNRYLSQP